MPIYGHFVTLYGYFVTLYRRLITNMGNLNMVLINWSNFTHFLQTYVNLFFFCKFLKVYNDYISEHLKPKGSVFFSKNKNVILTSIGVGVIAISTIP